MKIVKTVIIIFAISHIFCQDLKFIDKIVSDDFYKLTKIIVVPKSIYLLDVGNTKIYQFTNFLKLFNVIGSYGLGPGEFVEPNDILVNGDTLWVLDHSSMRINTFINGDFVSFTQLEIMPISFDKIGNRFSVGHVFSSVFMANYSMDGSHIDSVSFQGASKLYFKGSPFPIFSALTHMASSEKYIYLTYEYKNAVEKYNSNLQLIKSTFISEYIEEPEVRDGGGNQFYIDGMAIAKDIQFYQNKVYVLWMAQNEQIECEGLSQLSVFDSDLNHEQDITLPDCIVGFDIHDGKLYGVCEEPEPQVVIYNFDY